MDGELALTIALIAHGNAFLLGDEPRAPDLESSNSAFQYVSSIRFLQTVNGRSSEVAEDVGGWLNWLRHSGMTRLHLRVTPTSGSLPAHIAAAFAGGGSWVILATGGDGAGSVWVPRSALRNAGTQRQWMMSYVAFSTSQVSMSDSPDLTTAREDLSAWLSAAQRLANDLSVEPWRDWFTAALGQLAASEPHARYHDDALPASGYSLSARQLFAAAVGSWVFGGMGSWNDMVVEDKRLQRRHEQISAALFQGVLIAFEAVLESGERR